MIKKIVIILTISLFLSCETVGFFADIAGASGIISSSQASAISESAEAGSKALEEITPSQEYYIGRAVGATILDMYIPYQNSEATLYINKIGRLLSLNSDRPETFGGYHFLILDSDEINAFAAPSGHIFISRGLINLTENEDELAAILAHEISHVVLKHGLSAIKKSRVTGFLTVLGTNAAKELGSDEVSELTTIFEDSISDITLTLVNSGYSRKFENEADVITIDILKKSGYDKYALSRVLKKMNSGLDNKGAGFGKTHPDPLDRIKQLEKSTDLVGFGHTNQPLDRYISNIKGL